MLVDLRGSIGRHHASDCDWGTWRPRHRGAKIAIRLGPPCLSDRASRDCQPIGPLLLCANRSIWDAHATDHWECHYNGSAESYLRMGRTFALHLLALDALPKGQVMRWQASQEGMQTMLHHYPPEAGGLALWGSSIFRLWERAPAHFSEHNVTNLAFGGGSKLGSIALRQRNSFSPAAQHHLVLLRQQRRECRGRRGRYCRAFSPLL